MKTTIRNSAFFGLALFAFLSVATVTRANDDQKEKSSIEFKYVGKRENQSLFQLQMNVSQGEEFLIRFRDKEGYVLYSSYVKSDVNQKFAIDTDEVDNTVTVEVRSIKTKKVQTFTITRSQTLLDETVVAKS